MLDETNPPFSTCVRCNDCDGFPCLVHAKSDAEVLGVRPALQHENVTLLINAQAVRLNTNPNGTAISEVVVKHDGQTETFQADIVVVSCGAANSAKLLLLSANDKHRAGLANGSDQVGRNYIYHNSQAVLAISREPNPTRFQKTLGLNDFYFGAKDFEFPLGNIQMVGKSQGPMYKGEKPIEAGLAPKWTLDMVAEHAVDFWLSTEDLPKPENRVTVNRDETITLSYTPSNEVPKTKLYQKLKSMLGHLDMHDHLIPRDLYLKNEIGIAGCAHQAGTCRFGTDPKSSVLDINCKAHELDNLYVVDTSFFPSIGAVNPGSRPWPMPCVSAITSWPGLSRSSYGSTQRNRGDLSCGRCPGNRFGHIPRHRNHLHGRGALRPFERTVWRHVSAPGDHGGCSITPRGLACFQWVAREASICSASWPTCWPYCF